MVRVLAGVRWMFRVTGIGMLRIIVVEDVRWRDRTVKRKMLMTADNSNRKFSCTMHSQRNAVHKGGRKIYGTNSSTCRFDRVISLSIFVIVLVIALASVIYRG